MCIHMSEEMKTIDELIKEAARVNKTRKKLKQLGFTDKEIYDMVEHFVVEKIQQPMEG